jgi:isopenicillin N synthase-like dioxygenase
LDEYSSELKKVSDCLYKLMDTNLELAQQTLVNFFTDGGRQTVRMNYYPPCPQANKVLGLSPHSDGGGITLLLQANGVQGLQIKKNGKWISVNPFPGALIANIGDMLEVCVFFLY